MIEFLGNHAVSVALYHNHIRLKQLFWVDVEHSIFTLHPSNSSGESRRQTPFHLTT